LHYQIKVMKIYKLHANQSGIALMVVLWVLVLLMALATEFAFSMKGEVNTTRNFKEDIQTYHLAKAGVHLAMAEILSPSSFHALHKDFGFIIGPSIKDLSSLDQITYRSSMRQEIKFGDGKITYTIKDENSKIPINKTSLNTLVKVLTAVGVESKEEKDIIANSILDWIDTDKIHRLNGAENDFYQNLTPPYFAKNAPIETLDELSKIRGIDKKILYGTNKQKGLINFFTTYNVKSVNPNTASPKILSIIFSESQAKSIIREREKKGFYDKTTSDYFRIISTGKTNESPTKHTINTVVQKIFEKEQPIILTHYWNDNSFKSLYKTEQTKN
jgi:general secretion pathway protein K